MIKTVVVTFDLKELMNMSCERHSLCSQPLFVRHFGDTSFTTFQDQDLDGYATCQGEQLYDWFRSTLQPESPMVDHTFYKRPCILWI